MRITATDRYRTHNAKDCGMVCERNYCPEHRLLWMDCETAIETFDGAGQTWQELRECPECMAMERAQKLQRLKAYEH